MMKDFDSYRVPNDRYWSYGDKEAYRQQLINEINNDRLTEAERKLKLSKVPSLVREKESEVNKSAKEEQSQLERKFWDDARKELGYTSYLTDDGIKKLERMAYERGHSNGYSQVFYELQDLNDFLNDIINHLKR